MDAQANAWLSKTVSIWSEGIVRACWLGSIFIMVVWIVCRFFPRLSPAARHWLWWLACLKLILSLIWVTPVNLPVLRARTPDTKAAGSQIELPAPPIQIGGGATPQSSEQVSQPPSRVSLQVALFLTWVVGVSACLVKIVTQSVLIRRIARGGCSLDNSASGAQARQMGVLLGIRRAPQLLTSSEVSSPLVVGLVAPAVILPDGLCESLSQGEFRAVLAHELAHVRRNDLLLGFVPAIAYSVFFALPPLWLAYREWQTTREAACDAEALSVAGLTAGQYAELLLKIVGQDNGPVFRSALGATAGYHTLKTRLLLLKALSTGKAQNLRGVTGALAIIALLALAPWRVTARHAASAQALTAGVSNRSANDEKVPDDVADIPCREIHAEGDANKRCLLMGPRAAAPPGGYRLLVVLPGGDGGTDFQWFVRRILKFALPTNYLVVQPIAPVWAPDQASSVVWPTETNPWPRMKFSTEELVDSVIRDVAARQKLDIRFVFTLGWASGGPPAFAVSLRKPTHVTGSFVAMSVFNQFTLPPLSYASGQPYYLFQPSDVPFLPVKDSKRAQTLLVRNGAKVELTTYQGGYGWPGNALEQISKGVTWLEAHHAK